MKLTYSPAAIRRRLPTLCLIVWSAAICTPKAQAQLPQSIASTTLKKVRARGRLVCGVAGDTAGMSVLDSQGIMRGLDADSCRAVAAAVLGDAIKTEFINTTIQNRFDTLRSGRIDLLARNSTWSLGREGDEGVQVAWTNFYDGTTLAVRNSLGFKSVNELRSATICVLDGSPTAQVVKDYSTTHTLRWTLVPIPDLVEEERAFLAGRCVAIASISSVLAVWRLSLGPEAGTVVLLPEQLNEEPLGVYVRKGDDKWFDIVRWTFVAMISAEQKGITSQNIDSFSDSKDTEIRRLLGLEVGVGKSLGLDNDWAYNVIKQVGNLGQLWTSSFGATGIERGKNNIWTKGGLQYAPPIR